MIFIKRILQLFIIILSGVVIYYGAYYPYRAEEALKFDIAQQVLEKNQVDPIYRLKVLEDGIRHDPYNGFLFHHIGRLTFDMVKKEVIVESSLATKLRVFWHWPFPKPTLNTKQAMMLKMSAQAFMNGMRTWPGPSFYLELGRSELYRCRYEEALWAFQQAQNYDPTMQMPVEQVYLGYTRLGCEYYQAGEHNRARMVWEKGLPWKLENDADIELCLASYYLLAEDGKKCREFLTRAEKKTPNDPYLFFLKAECTKNSTESYVYYKRFADAADKNFYKRYLKTYLKSRHPELLSQFDDSEF